MKMNHFNVDFTWVCNNLLDHLVTRTEVSFKNIDDDT